MKRKSEKYFYRPEFCNQLISFAYAVTPKDQQLVNHTGLMTYFGYAPEQLDTLSLADMWHPNEQKKIVRLEQALFDFAKTNAIPNGDLSISMVNQMKKADNTYIKVWRRVYPFLSQEAEAICVYGIDLTPHYSGDKITFQVVHTATATLDMEMVESYFAEALLDSEVRFTDRQLEVLRVCSQVDSAKAAAMRLGIEIRTLETHLKNARKRVNVKRTMDAILYAKSHGWI